jgi:iron complex transport system permease protein
MNRVETRIDAATRASPLASLPKPRGRWVLPAAAIALVILAIASLAIGPTGVSLGSLPRAVKAGFGGEITDPVVRREHLVLFGIRLPRLMLGAFVGGALAIAGAMMQGLFRNPLADPGLIGVSSGAALAAVATIALGSTPALAWMRVFGFYALPVAAFAGGLVTSLILMWIANRGGSLSVATLLLSGVAIAAIAGALTGLMAYVSDDRELRDLTLWSMGSLAGSSWTKVIAILPFVVALGIVTPSLTRALNGFLLGEAEAFHLGIAVERVKLVIIVTTAAAVGAAVAVAGVVGFVGLVVPHFVRLLTGPDHRMVLPVSAVLGAALVVGADVVARIIVAPAELPLGIVMAVIGGPVFLHLVLSRGVAGAD